MGRDIVRRGPIRLRPLTALCLLLVTAACGGCDATDPATDVAWRAGSGFLDDPGALAWRSGAAFLPATIGDTDGTAHEVTIRVADWVRVSAAPAPSTLDLGPDALVFEALPVVDLRLGGSRPDLSHEGRDLPRMHAPGVPNLWRDGATGLTFLWRREEGLLLAFGTRPPGELVMRSAAPAGPALAPAPARDALAAASVSVGAETRPARWLPVPGELTTASRRVDAKRLHLALAVLPRAYRRDGDGRLLHAPIAGVPIAVQVKARDGLGDTVDLLSHVLTAPATGFAELTVDLAPVSGRSIAFELSFRPLRKLDGVVPVVALADGRFGGGGSVIPTRPHVVLISLDTLRRDRLGCYGSPRATSPRLDAWAAARAQVFDDAVADSNWTLPSTASLLTGLSTGQHGVLAFPSTLDERTRTLAEILSEAGYGSTALTEGGFVSPAFGMHRGFDLFVVQPHHGSDWSRALERVVRRGEDQPQFLFLHTYRAHSPWPEDERFADPAAPYAGPLAGRDLTDDVLDALQRGEIPAGPAEQAEVRRRYDAAVARLDVFVGPFLDDLEAALPVGRRMIVVTSDHGEHLFEHGHITHGRSLHGAVLDVPLLVSWPGGVPTGRSAAPAAGVDLVPTVLDVLGLRPPADLPGRSLWHAAAAPVLRVSQHADLARAADFDGWKLIAPDAGRQGAGRPTLFHRASDPAELADRSLEDGPRADRLAQALAEWLARHPPPAGGAGAPAELDAGQIDDLTALGYLGDG